MKKLIIVLLKISTLLALIILAAVCFINAKNIGNSKHNYDDLPLYKGTLTLTGEVQIINMDELCVYSYGYDSYAYKNVLDKQDTAPILVYKGQRLDFKYESFVVDYKEGDTVVKCKINSLDTYIKGTLEFELPTLNEANENLKTKTYFPYLFSGTVLALFTTLLKFISRTGEKKDEKIADYAYAVKYYDLSKKENEVLKGILTDGIKKAGYASLESFINITKTREKMRLKYNTLDIIADYLSASAWLCGITAAIIALMITDITLGLGTKWLIFVPILVVGYGLKFYARCIKDKEKKDDLA